jgi:hypothetical protein
MKDKGARWQEEGRGGMHLRRRVLRHDGSLCRFKATTGSTPLLGAGDKVRTTKCRCSRLHVGHRGSHAPSRCPRSPPVDRVWIGCAGGRNASCRMKN